MKNLAAAVALAAAAFAAHAAPTESLPTTGTLVVVPAFGEVKHVNDQATITLSVEEVDKDKAAAASRVNLKMKQGLEIVKKEDPQASLKTQGYYTYQVYPEETAPQPGQSRKPRVPTAWRVGQSLQAITTNIAGLPKTVAAAQRILALNNLRFGLTPETTRKLDDQRIAATYANLTERVRSIANAMGRQVGDAVVDTVDFEGSGNFADRVTVAGAARAPMAMLAKGADTVEEPSFEPGETTLQMRLVGKVRFK
ncbi:SIMPL domain-containing protein [Duganella aceris]|uniref:SIMPL domain-containing protein n=1 Tax=Duganella aceris TaxID=2703883 RepID=A0ABX0FLT0_9BURK|nr:SIMPL domain-containing protein [Duganella aceris]NGZ85477.1 SIMPL domain-containing protein [Duganella aceris]